MITILFIYSRAFWQIAKYFQVMLSSKKRTVNGDFLPSVYHNNLMSVCNQKYVTTDITIPLVIYAIFSMVIK